MLLFVDNADSFTFNVVQALRELEAKVDVRAAESLDATALAELERTPPTALVLGPGPGRPETAAANLALLERFSERLTVLGLCLGHQALAHHFGGRLERSRHLLHGQTCAVHHEGRTLFAGLPSPLTMTRYHSLCVREATLPPELEVTARDETGEILGLSHRELPLHGLQFHPEAIRSVGGVGLLQNFLKGLEERRDGPTLASPPRECAAEGARMPRAGAAAAALVKDPGIG